MKIICTCEPDIHGHKLDCALNLEISIQQVERNLDHLKKKLSASLNASKRVIYVVDDQPIALGNFFHRVKDEMEKLEIDDPQIEFAIINGKICVVESEWEE